jgi:hypothetical protein
MTTMVVWGAIDAAKIFWALGGGLDTRLVA